jgi:hypothetical protein
LQFKKVDFFFFAFLSPQFFKNVISNDSISAILFKITFFAYKIAMSNTPNNYPKSLINIIYFPSICETQKIKYLIKNKR